MQYSAAFASTAPPVATAEPSSRRVRQHTVLPSTSAAGSPTSTSTLTVATVESLKGLYLSFRYVIGMCARQHKVAEVVCY